MGVEMILPDVGPGNKRGLGSSCGRPIRGVHTLGDWPVVPTEEVDKGEEGGGDKGRAPPQGDRPSLSQKGVEVYA